MGDERATYLKTDTAGAITFLKALRPAGPWVLTAIWPDGPTTTQSFEASDEVGATRFIKDASPRGRNLYFTGNSCGKPGSKPKKADMTGAIMLHADSDPRDGETIEAAKKRILAAYAAHDPPPSIIVDSGNGLQGLWLLEREFVFPKLTSAPKSKAYDEEVQMRVAPSRGSQSGFSGRDRRPAWDAQRRPAAAIARDDQFSQREEDGAGPDHTPVEHRQANRRSLSP